MRSYFPKRDKKKSCSKWLPLTGALVAGVAIALVGNHYYEWSSTDEACMACHFHPEATDSWKQAAHYNNRSGVKTGCAECHLPPEGTWEHFTAKARMGMHDVWSAMTKKKEDIDFASKRELEYAQTIVFNESCKRCHVNLFPQGLSDDGVSAHLYYEDNEEKLGLQCISCHLDAGHTLPGYKHAKMDKAPVDTTAATFAEATPVTKFADFTEQVPTTSITISMKAIPGGTFLMGSQKGEKFSQPDEQPQRKVSVSAFYMAETEITWDQYWAFYAQTMSEGRTPPSKIYANNSRPDVDAVSGPTPPFGMPDQGWGMGKRPAITMTHYAAETFCQWLSLKTGKKYRLPTEAEWEYAARGGTETPYFFEGKPANFSNTGFWRRFFSADTTAINGYIIYANNSKSRTQEPSRVKPNPFGLKNMLGNVLEYCSDWYAEDAYSQMQDGAKDPKGPASGTEYVVRGGCYADDAANVRCASRAHTEYDKWLKTDPQNPKSIWWFSDMKGIGFRVVCELPQGVSTN